MAREYRSIPDPMRDWIGRQAMFFVATAPLAPDGHLNVSPKGPIGSLRILDENTAAYLDVTGSGAETIAHLRENGRIVIMLCAFDGPPRIVRLHGRGEVVFATEDRFDGLLSRCGFEDPSIPEARRAIVVVEVTRASESCGYGVPLMSFERDRDHHALSSAKKLRTMGPEGYAEHLGTKNQRSLDGLPAVDANLI